MNSIAPRQTDPFLPVPVPASGRNSASPASAAGTNRPAADAAGSLFPADRVTLSSTARAAGAAATRPPDQTNFATYAPSTPAAPAQSEAVGESPLARQQIRLKYGLPGEKIPNRETRSGNLLHIVI